MKALYDSKSKTMNDYGIRQYLTKEAKYRSWLEVEAALAMAQGEVGVIPMEAARQIEKNARYEALDLDEIERIYREIGHNFVPFLKVLASICENDSGKYVHYGVTTQNIQQTGQLLVTKKIHHKFLFITKLMLQNLAVLAEENADAVMAGRTHGRHAIPITYGYKAAVWISELTMAIERLEGCEARVFLSMMGGAVGAFNAMPETGEAVQELVALRLEMPAMTIPSRNISTHKIEYIMNLALLANVCHKIAEEVYSTSIEEYGEVAEGFTKGTVGSSTMPHKINPKLAKGIIANSQKLYSISNLGLYSSIRPFEGDSSSYMLFDHILEEALELMVEILLRAEELTRTLTVNQERLLKNVKINGGLDNSEYVMMKIADKLGKEQAHSLVYELAMEKLHSDKAYLEILEGNETLKKNFTPAEIQAMLEPSNYTGLSAKLAKRMACQARAKAAVMAEHE